jgi:hypothetical protein
MITALMENVIKNILHQKYVNIFHRSLLPWIFMKHMMFMNCFKEVKRILVSQTKKNLRNNHLVHCISGRFVRFFKIQWPSTWSQHATNNIISLIL